eukprot:325137-Karenia_brevis.AAC.1
MLEVQNDEHSELDFTAPRTSNVEAATAIATTMKSCCLMLQRSGIVAAIHIHIAIVAYIFAQNWW